MTRLWSKNLSTITMVTAEEIAKASTGGDIFALPTAEMMGAPESSLRDLLDREQAKARKEKGLGVDGSSPSGDKPAGGVSGEGLADSSPVTWAMTSPKLS